MVQLTLTTAPDTHDKTMIRFGITRVRERIQSPGSSAMIAGSYPIYSE